MNHEAITNELNENTKLLIAKVETWKQKLIKKMQS